MRVHSASSPTPALFLSPDELLGFASRRAEIRGVAPRLPTGSPATRAAAAQARALFGAVLAARQPMRPGGGGGFVASWRRTRRGSAGSADRIRHRGAPQPRTRGKIVGLRNLPRCACSRAWRSTRMPAQRGLTRAKRRRTACGAPDRRAEAAESSRATSASIDENVYAHRRFDAAESLNRHSQIGASDLADASALHSSIFAAIDTAAGVIYPPPTTSPRPPAQASAA